MLSVPTPEPVLAALARGDASGEGLSGGALVALRVRALTLLLTLPSPSPWPLLQRFPQVCWDWLLARAVRLHSRQRGVQQRQRAPFVNLPALGASRSLPLFRLSAYLLPLWPALPVALPGRPCASFKHTSPLLQQSIFPLPAAVDVAQHRRC